MRDRLRAFCVCRPGVIAAALLALGGGSPQAGVVWQSNGVAACAASGTQETPSVVSLGGAGAVVVWADRRGLDYDIYAQRLSAEGSALWTSGGVIVCGQPYDQQFPVACDDGAGGVIVAWQDGRQGDDGMEIYAQRLRPDATAVWTAGGLPVCTHASGLTDPPTAFSHVITSDGTGGAVIAWRDTRTDPVVGNTEIYAQRIDGTGAPQWTVNGVRLLGFGEQKWASRNPIVCADGSGGAVVAWQDARNATSTANDLYAQRITAAGSVAWTANGVAVCNAPADQGYPDILHAGGGSAVIVWEDKRSGSYDIYAQKLDAAGTPLWGAGGACVCSSAGDQRTPRVVDDGASGAIIVWTDKRSSPTYTDIYAQRLDRSGTAQWTAQGNAVCTAAGSQTRVRMCSAPGSVILTWMDTRNESTVALYDLFGQMLDTAGMLRWDSQGVPVAAITGTNQRMQQAAGDGAGFIYSVWEDDRSGGDWDIYARRLEPWTPVADIADAKSRPDGTAVSVPARVVTGAFGGFFYVQEADRRSGVRVLSPETVAVGSKVAVSGTVETGCERCIRASVVTLSGPGTAAEALGVGPSTLGSQTVGTVHGPGNVGLLVSTWGRVVINVSGPPGYLVITDGRSEVRVYGCSQADEDDYVIATGICSCEPGSSGPVPVILTRSSDDIRVVSR